MSDDASKPCSDCGVGVGDKHTANCTIARCLVTGLQRATCNQGIDTVPFSVERWFLDPPHFCGDDLWTGVFPGTVEAREYNWWCRRATPEEKPGLGRWIPCLETSPGAVLDLTRVVTYCVWDSVALRWRKPDDPDLPPTVVVGTDSVWPDLTVKQAQILRVYFDTVCGDCVDGKCHFGPRPAGPQPGDGPCGCHRHNASVHVRQFNDAGPDWTDAVWAWWAAGAPGYRANQKPC